ncbi:hypothetical protein KY347_04580 [Candidatus Woesearchaeota archaeon]|nr:hypothetical protein [Candidatus Woesearchaeota archaeon]
MNKKIIFGFIAIGLFFIAGCNVNVGGGNNPKTDADVKKGTGGLTMEFVKNAPPISVFEYTVFPIALNLKNAGAFDIGDEIEGTSKKGKLVLGLEKNYMDVAELGEGKQDFEINGKSIYNLNGDEELITINAKAKSIGAQSETRSVNILATACYPYKTFFGSSVCIDPDVYGMRRGAKACSIADLGFDKGQGAPVAITRIESRMLMEADKNVIKPNFVIYIENRGNGEVISLNKIDDACSQEPLSYEDFNTLIIKASLAGNKLKCNIVDGAQQTTIKLRGKKDRVMCTLDDGVDMNLDAYTAPLDIELSYGYTTTISKNIIIERLLTY